jgi:hypothetical protein
MSWVFSRTASRDSRWYSIWLRCRYDVGGIFPDVRCQQISTSLPTPTSSYVFAFHLFSSSLFGYRKIQGPRIVWIQTSIVSRNAARGTYMSQQLLSMGLENSSYYHRLYVFRGMRVTASLSHRTQRLRYKDGSRHDGMHLQLSGQLRGLCSPPKRRGGCNAACKHPKCKPLCVYIPEACRPGSDAGE